MVSKNNDNINNKAETQRTRAPNNYKLSNISYIVQKFERMSYTFLK